MIGFGDSKNSFLELLRLRCLLDLQMELSGRLFTEESGVQDGVKLVLGMP